MSAAFLIWMAIGVFTFLCLFVKLWDWLDDRARFKATIKTPPFDRYHQKVLGIYVDKYTYVPGVPGHASVTQKAVYPYYRDRVPVAEVAEKIAARLGK